ncbi:MAG: hypothetical protein HY788_17780 [Deltaproteobacteria bacterium]|nr:hypothetical protein [Deltaproteobacteria bacterium]
MKKIVLVSLVLIAGLTAWAAVTPYGERVTLPTEKRECLDCHHRRNIATYEGVMSSRAFCQECHAQESCRGDVQGKPVSLQVNEDPTSVSRHSRAACIHCHTDVARSPHRSVEGVQCLGCHAVHGEAGTQASPHLRVRCEACHTDSRFVLLDPADRRVRLAHLDDKGEPIRLSDHRMTVATDRELCDRCHYSGNAVGASAATPPAKSFLCVMCHNAPLSIGHWMFWVTLIVLVAGLFLMVAFWFQGSVAGETKSTHGKVAAFSELTWDTVFSRHIGTVLSTLLFDVLLQRRILKESVKRWTIHSTIFLAFMGRLFLSLLTMIWFGLNPESDIAVALLDKNHWFVAFINDFLGLMILVGVFWAAGQRLVWKPQHVLTEEQDNITLALVGLLTLSGFALEGARILITGLPVDVAGYSFLGLAFSRLWALWGLDWQGAFNVLWYIHAVMWILFLMYLPFGKLKHAITVPLNLIIRSLKKDA